MQLNLRVNNASEYFALSGRKIDLLETGNEKMISMRKAAAIDDIISIEASIIILRNSSSTDDFYVTIMHSLRNRFIHTYETSFNESYLPMNIIR